MTASSMTTDPGPVELPRARTHPFDPPLELTHLREQSPICRLRYPDGHLGWLITGYALAREVLVDARFGRSFADPVPGGFLAATTNPVYPGQFIDMDPPDHTRYRRLLAGDFTMRKMMELKPRIEQIVEARLDAMEDAGPPVDLMAVLALPIPTLTICDFLGVSYERSAELQRCFERILTAGMPADAVHAARAELDALVLAILEHRRRSPDEGLLSRLIATGELSDEELVAIAELLFVGGFETTSSMLALGTLALLRHPGQWDALRRDPALVDDAVEELLRYLTILQYGVGAKAREDVEVAGHLIRAGEDVRISLPAANRDPGQYDRPDELDVTRGRVGHLAFSHGIHVCIGQHLARVELRIGFAGLVRRFPKLRVAVPLDELRLGDDMMIYGIHELPVAW